MWHGITGQGKELQAEIYQDIVEVQRSTVTIVQEIMKEEIRTRTCVEAVVRNLEAMATDQDELARRTEILRANQEQLRAELFAAIKAESSLLMGKIHGVERRLELSDVTRRLTTRFMARGLHPGTGPILESALFLATIGWLHAGNPDGDREWRTALAVAKDRLGGNEPMSLEEVILQAAEQVNPGLLEASAYSLDSPRLQTCSVLQEVLLDRASGSVPSQSKIEDTLQVNRSEQAPRILQRRIIRPLDLVESLGQELNRIPFGGIDE